MSVKIRYRGGIRPRFQRIQIGHMPGGTWLYCIGPIALFVTTRTPK